MIAAVVVLLAVGVSARAETLEVTSGHLSVFFLTGDVGYDIRGAGFEIGPGGLAGTPLTSVDHVLFAPVDNVVGLPPIAIPEFRYLEMFFNHNPVNPFLDLGHVGDQLSMGFTMTGTTGSVDLSDFPFFRNRQADTDLTGRGTLTVTALDNGQGTVGEWEFVYVFPEPSTLLLVAGGILLIGSTRRWCRR